VHAQASLYCLREAIDSDFIVSGDDCIKFVSAGRRGGKEETGENERASNEHVIDDAVISFSRQLVAADTRPSVRPSDRPDTRASSTSATVVVARQQPASRVSSFTDATKFNFCP